MASLAIECIERLPALDLGETVAGGAIDHAHRHRFGDQAEYERRHRFAGFGFFLQAASFEGFVAFARFLAAAREAELRHTGPIVPRFDAVVIVAARIVQLLEEVAFAIAVPLKKSVSEETIQEGSFVTLSLTLGASDVAFLIGPLFDDVIVAS